MDAVAVKTNENKLEMISKLKNHGINYCVHISLA